MAERFDLLVLGGGVGAMSAAITAARAGLSTGFVPMETFGVERYADATGLLFAPAMEQIEPGFAGGESAAPGLSKVTLHRLCMIGDDAGTTVDFRSAARAEHPDTFTFERRELDSWMLTRAAAAGVHQVASDKVVEFMHGEDGQLRAVKTKNGTVIRCKAVIIGTGAESLVKDVLDAALPPEERKIGTATVRIGLAAERIQERFGIGAGEAAYGRIIGTISGELPGAGWMLTRPDAVVAGMRVVCGPHETDAGAVAAAHLNKLLAHGTMAALLKGGIAGMPVAVSAPVPGYKAIAPLYGDGWVLVGSATRLADPLRNESSHCELTAGMLAAQAVERALKAEDTSARALSVYRHMLDDSHVIANLKARRNAVEDLEKDPSLATHYTRFVNRMFAHDTEATLMPRAERNRDFFRAMRNERPVWEFAMGMRKGLKLLRD